MNILLPVGQLLAINIDYGLTLSNIHPNHCTINGEVKIIHLSVTGDVGEKRFVIDGLNKRQLSRSGVFDETQNDYFHEGKFVFYANNVFMISNTVNTHGDLQSFIKPQQRSHAVGAGFVTINPDRLSLYGRSVSLDDLKPRIDRLDKMVIAAHLGLVPHLLPQCKAGLLEFEDFTVNHLPDQYRKLYEKTEA